jgi:activator of 2-hydroxyglutaryl-CoA dehydratase
MSLGRQILEAFSQLYGVNFLIPEWAEFATAAGAALQGYK